MTLEAFDAVLGRATRKELLLETEVTHARSERSAEQHDARSFHSDSNTNQPAKPARAAEPTPSNTAPLVA